MDYFQFKNLSQYPEIIHGFSTKDYGGMKIGWPDAEKNLKKFSDDLSIDVNNIVRGFPEFTDQVKIVSQKDCRQQFKNIDGLVTAETDTFLIFTFADCVPIYVYDPVKKVCGLAHAGWKNILKNIAGKLIKTMQQIGGDSKNFIAGIGPGIGPDHFEVNQEIFEKFSGFPSAQIKRKNKYFIDLWEINKMQLIKTGILEQNVETSNECTYCKKEKYFSYRRNFYGKSKFPTMAAIIGRK